MLYYFCTCFRAVASPTKLSCTQSTRVNFQRLFMMVACVVFPVEVVCWTSVRILCPDILKIYFIVFVFKLE